MSAVTLDKTESVVTLDTDSALQIVKGDLAHLISLTKPEERKLFTEWMQGFEKLFHQFLLDRKTGNTVVWSEIQPPPATAMKDYESIPQVPIDKAKSLLDKLVVLKLNGGLGTTMGCVGPKSLISVRNDKNFLDLTVMQIESINRKYGSDVPLVLMNSFNTHADTLRIKHKYSNRVDLHMFEQSCYPRVLKETLRPYPDSIQADQSCWYPPGHGDVYASLKRSGMLDYFVKQGKEIVFISNIDNLGATIDIDILGFLVESSSNLENSCEFVMEVTGKTRSDVKGGTLIQYNNALRLLELAEVPKEHEDDFKAITKFKVFNTNNLWARLSAIDHLVQEDGLTMSIIVNRKTLDNGINIIQLETAAGAAIQNFRGAMGVNVPRRRFLPVKTTSDLLVVMSNLFTLDSEGYMALNPARLYPTLPLVKLGDHHFKKVQDFLRRFESVPDLLELDHLTVSGDVTLGKRVSLKGTVIIIANHGDRIDIPAGANLENKIVSGNLRILDH